MIVKMKKVSLVILNSGKEASLRKLKKLGVVHLEKITGAGDKLKDLEENRVFLEKCFYSIPEVKKDVVFEKYSDIESTLETARKIDSISGKISELVEKNNFYRKELERLTSIGDFDPADILELREKGINISIFQLSRDEASEFPMEKSFVISSSKAGTIVAKISGDGDEIPDHIQIELPEKSPAAMAAEIEQNLGRIDDLKKELESFTVYSENLKTGMAALDDEIGFENVHSGMGSEEELAYLSGFCPENKVDVLKSYSAKHGWAVLIKEPEEDEQPPTLLQNNRVVRIIQPVFDILGTVPGYREFDISIWFLMFFTLFFAMIIGDAAYGSIFLLITVIVNIRIKKIPDGLKLLYVLSIATIIWGSLTGSWFGSPEIAKIPFFAGLIYEPISNFNPLSGETIKVMCFVIGTVHLVLAHFKSVIRKFPTLVALSDLGWLIMILGLYYLVLNMVIDPNKYPLPPYALYMIVGGLVLLVIFGQQQKGQNFFKGILMGIANLFTTFLDSISAFSDIISYIRLYAVGLATLAISQSFNSMAAGVGGGPGIIAAALILLLGHGLNIGMALLSVVVHGVRLNVLEFSSHLGMEWSGIKYEPFMEAALPAGGAEVGVNETENSLKNEE